MTLNSDIIIIGGGIAGLSAGCYAQMNGYRSQIFEMNSKPGGCCTAWERKGYVIDTCVHWLIGSRPPSPFFKLWEEVGAVQGKTMIEHDVYAWVEGKNGQIFQIFGDVEKTYQYMLEIAPEDKKIIREFVHGIKKCKKFPMSVDKPFELYSKWDVVKTIVKMMPFGVFYKKWVNITLQEFANKFKSPFLKEMFSEALLDSFGGNLELPMLNILMTFAMLDQKTACFPLGGSNGLVDSIVERYISLGGEINHNTKVKEIIVEKDQAVGIRLEDNSEYRAKIVISAADGYQTIFKLLDGKYLSDNLRDLYSNLKLVKPIVQVSFGLNYKFENLPNSVAGYIIPLKKGIKVDTHEIHWLLFQIYQFDPSLAPPGKNILKVIIVSDYAYWKQLAESREKYEKQKEILAKDILNELELKYPGLTKNVEMIDVATPLTFEKYTGNREGSYMGWLVNPDSFSKVIEKALPGLKNFYMIGQWVKIGGGLPTVLGTGRDIIQIICKEDNKIFKASTP